MLLISAVTSATADILKRVMFTFANVVYSLVLVRHGATVVSSF